MISSVENDYFIVGEKDKTSEVGRTTSTVRRTSGRECKIRTGALK